MRTATNIRQHIHLEAGAEFLVTQGKVGPWHYKSERLLGEDVKDFPPVIRQLTRHGWSICASERAQQLKEIFKRCGVDLNSQTPHPGFLKHYSLV